MIEGVLIHVQMYVHTWYVSLDAVESTPICMCSVVLVTTYMVYTCYPLKTAIKLHCLVSELLYIQSVELLA